MQKNRIEKKKFVPNWERITLHKQYLSDEVRNLSYREAIGKAVTPESVVVDVGSGTGILGFFAIQAGCRKLYSIEASEFIHHAKETARLNNFLDRTEFIQSDFFKVSLPERADLIIHEQIGDYLWEEGMIEKMAYARKFLLKTGGKILPARFDLYLVPVCNPGTFVDRKFWEKPHYGIDFRNFADVEQSQAEIMSSPKKVYLKNDESFLASPVRVASTDLYLDEKKPDRLKARFEIEKSSICTGILGFFDVHLDEEVSFSTKPAKVNTNWGQFLLPITDQKLCLEGDVIDVEVDPSDALPENWSWKFELEEKSPRRSTKPLLVK